jgi:hypothetical protein
MRTKLGLTNSELMNKSWIALNLELADYPGYDYKAKKAIDVKEATDDDPLLGKFKS